MKVCIKIGEVEVTIAEENQRTSREFNDRIQLECLTMAKDLYEKYIQGNKQTESNVYKESDDLSDLPETNMNLEGIYD